MENQDESEVRKALTVLSRYHIIFQDADPIKVAKLHTLVKDTRDELISNTFMQDVLFNRGYILDEEKRPRSYLDISCGIPNRRLALVHLALLERMLEIVSGPVVIAPETKIVASMKEAIQGPRLMAHGLDYTAVESFRSEWTNQPGVRKEVEEYRTQLGLAFDEYNLGLVLNLIQAKGISQFLFPEWKEQNAVQERFKVAFDRQAYSCLDSAYYNAGNREYNLAGQHWEKLNESEFGKKFILSRQEALKAVFGRK